MNPEEEKNQGATAADTLNQAIAPAPAAPAPEVAPDSTPAAEAAPSLDQVAADLTSAAATDTLETPTEPATPAAPVEPVAEPTIEPTPATIPVAEPAPAPDMTAPVEASPVAEPAPVAPAAPIAPEAPVAPITPEPPVAPAAPEAPEVTPEATSLIPPAAPEEEPPLVPADPVPGSIGSAISYSDTPTAEPVEKPKKSFNLSLKPSKDNMRLILIIGAAVVLVAIVVIVIIFIVSGSTGKKSNNASNTTPVTPTEPTVSSLTCSKEGGSDVFGSYGEVVSGKEDIIVMYSEGYLDSFGTNLTLSYDNEDAARYGEGVAREVYNRALSTSSLSSDPFDSAYNVVDNTLTVTHQASGDDIEASNARALGLYVIKGEVVDDPDTLIDNYETDGYTCVEK
ncbi:hypothetical protein IKW75_01170 [Candidatus Saccharibacteria bacterium]|nr:hypothetical protein [Candidatus Saccharibacteria bacterium]